MWFLLVLIPYIILAGCPVKTYIPKKAIELTPIIIEEVNKTIPDFNYPYYFQALIEHESCVRLCGNNYWARRCWSPISEFRTKREQGVGFFQLTRTFRKDGSVRWDTIRSLRKKYPKELSELTWGNVKDRPDLQIKAGLLLWKSNWLYFSNAIPKNERMYFADSAFNGGYRWLLRERKLCKLKDGCDPKKWFNHVEKIKSKRAKRKLYGNRSAWDINRHHVRDVTKIRMDKYHNLYNSLIRYCYEINKTKLYILDMKLLK